MAGSYWDKVDGSTRIPAAGAAGRGRRRRGGRRRDGRRLRRRRAATTRRHRRRGNDVRPAAPAAARQRPADATRVGSTADFDTFDPYIGIAASVGYFPRLYNVLVNFSALDATFRFDDLSTKFEQPDPHDVRLHDPRRREGRPEPPRRARARRWTHRTSSRATSASVTLPQSNAYGFLGKWMESQEASADNKTYTFKTPKPYAYFNNRIGSAINTIVPKEALTDANISKLKQQAAGAGPFMLKSLHRGPGRGARQEPELLPARTTNNNNAQLPYIDGMDVKIITDQATNRDGVPVRTARHLFDNAGRRGEPAPAGAELHRHQGPGEHVHRVHDEPDEEALG